MKTNKERAMELMNKREDMINDLLESLKILGYDMATEIKTVEVIKEVEVVKEVQVEVVKDNTDYATIEKLNKELDEKYAEIAALTEERCILRQQLMEAQNKIAKLEEQPEEIVCDNIHADYQEIVEDNGNQIGAEGSITIGDKTHEFKFVNTQLHPVIYGCFDKDFLDVAYEYLGETIVMDDRMNALESNKNLPILDLDHKIFVWESNEGIFYGYTDKEMFVWNTSEELPCRCLFKYAHNTDGHFRTMNKAHGNGIYKRGLEIMEYIRQNFNVKAEETNEVVVDTNEEIYDDLYCKEVAELDL